MPRSPDPLGPYREAVAKTGPAFEALLWHSRDFQEVRFRVLIETAASGLGVPGLAGHTIADLGCGRADLLAWMRRSQQPFGGYVGVEGIPELAEESGRVAAGVPGASVVRADFAGGDDVFRQLVNEHGVSVMLFSGSLNTFEQKAAARVIDTAFDALDRSRTGAVVFNFLSDGPGRTKTAATDPARRFRSAELLRRYTDRVERVAYRRDYLAGHDATIGLFLAGTA